MNKLLKGAHMLYSSLWLGGSAGVAVLQCLRGWSHDGRALVGLNLDLGLLALTLIIPGALGSLLTGFLLCQTTGWHIMRCRWVIAKWIGALFGVLAASMLLIPWQIRLVNLSGELANSPLAADAYDVLRLPFTIISLSQVYLLLTMITVAVVKPWGERLPRRAPSLAARPLRAPWYPMCDPDTPGSRVPCGPTDQPGMQLEERKK